MFTTNVCVLVCIALVVTSCATRGEGAPAVSASASEQGISSYWPRAISVGEMFALEAPPPPPSVELQPPPPPPPPPPSARKQPAGDQSSDDQVTDQYSDQDSVQVTGQDSKYPVTYTSELVTYKLTDEPVTYRDYSDYAVEKEGDRLTPELTSDEQGKKAFARLGGNEAEEIERDLQPPPVSDNYYNYDTADLNPFVRLLVKLYLSRLGHADAEEDRARMTGRDSNALQRLRREASPSEEDTNSGESTGSYSQGSASAGAGQDFSRIAFPEFPEFPAMDFTSFGDNPELFRSNAPLFDAMSGFSSGLGMFSQNQHQGYAPNSQDREIQVNYNSSPQGFGARFGGSEDEPEFGAGAGATAGAGLGPGVGISASVDGPSRGSYSSSSSSDDGNGKKTLSVRTGLLN